MDDIEEYKALTSVFSAYYNYHEWEYDQLIKPRNIKFNSLPPDEQSLINWYNEHTDSIKQCIDRNKQFTQLVAFTICQGFGIQQDPLVWYEASHEDFDKVRLTLLQLTREWSDEGITERKIFDRIINDLNEQFPIFENRQKIKVLVPGCGLGSMIHQLVQNGYTAQGNEFSYHMLIMSNFILNCCSEPHVIYPFLHKLSNVSDRSNQIRGITIPNNLSNNRFQLLQQQYPNVPFMELMSMTAGSFTDLYGPDSLASNVESNEFRKMNEQGFDVVVTCFFIDTASNIIEYLKTLKYCLKPDGLWINTGPLLWHFENDFNMSYISNANGDKVPTITKGLELSRKDLLELIEKMDFKFLKFDLHENRISTIYSSDKTLLSNFIYNCEYWICSHK